MPVAAGTRLGPYEILAPIDAANMGEGEVYKASDTRLNRTVAIKVLPAHWAGNDEMKQRFEREARTVAGLKHPNICTLHDIGREADTDYLVLEYVEGETLAQRLERGALPMEEALRVAIAIADALDKAHREGVVHRDLKPSNILLTQGGPKLLDFGLATSRKPASSPEITTPGTVMSMVQYLAPEQLEDKEADERSDIFAFGAILYEMAGGRKAFEGKSRAILVATILTGEAEPLSKIQPSASPALDHLVARCLAKDPERRWQTAHSLVVQLRWIAGGGTGVAVPAEVSARRRKQERLVLALLAFVAFLIVAMATPTVLYMRGPADPDAFQFRIPVQNLSNTNIAISPDGRLIALVARADAQGALTLYVRPTDSITFQRLDGTADAAQPFWSPDSRFIAFVSGGKLKKIAAAGGPPKEIVTDAQNFFGGAWNSDDTIVFGTPKGLFRVSAEGGKATALTTVDASQKETGHYWPNFLPDGKHFVYLAWAGEATNRAVFLGSLDPKEKPQRLLAEESNAVYAAPGYLVFHRGASLFAQPFDTGKLKLTGEAAHVADEVAVNGADGRGSFDVSQEGTLLYFQGGASAGAPSGRGQTANSVLRWLDSTIRRLEFVDEPRQLGDFNLSPDENLIAITRQDAGTPGADVWTHDWQQGRWQKLTLDPGDDIGPVWSPKGDRIAYTTYRKGNADIYLINANGVGQETPLLESTANEAVKDWSKDGRHLLYVSGQDQFQDIYAVALTSDGKPDGKPFPVVQGHFEKNDPQFSYDGKWVAYVSNESGRFEVYVKSFPALDQREVVSTGGGGQPRWRKDSRELYYREITRGLPMAVGITPGPKIVVGAQRTLAGDTTLQFLFRDPVRHYWSAAPDGQRFLVLSNPDNFRARGSGQGAQSTMRRGPTNFTPAASGQTGPNGNRGNFFTGFTGPGRGGGAGGNGLTVVLHWTASIRKEAQ